MVFERHRKIADQFYPFLSCVVKVKITQSQLFFAFPKTRIKVEKVKREKKR